jgi:hypothetical protein
LIDIAKLSLANENLDSSPSWHLTIWEFAHIQTKKIEAFPAVGKTFMQKCSDAAFLATRYGS